MPERYRSGLSVVLPHPHSAARSAIGRAGATMSLMVLPNSGPAGLLRMVDAVMIAVPDLNAGLAFYRDRLGHQLLWRNDSIGQAGLRCPDSATEIVLSTRLPAEPNWLVESADDAAKLIIMAVGRSVRRWTFRSAESPWWPIRSGIAWCCRARAGTTPAARSADDHARSRVRAADQPRKIGLVIAAIGPKGSGTPAGSGCRTSRRT
ncbi:VOC family protein [Microlunatus elymi]|uniref:VOC family protein n=1 Tax=Microlunatus elymi TaxID=2596828 RepID=A0A516PYJ0_9ACTN|nr:VOC family protein [Microlunatus elymi]